MMVSTIWRANEGARGRGRRAQCMNSSAASTANARCATCVEIWHRARSRPRTTTRPQVSGLHVDAELGRATLARFRRDTARLPKFGRGAPDVGTHTYPPGPVPIIDTESVRRLHLSTGGPEASDKPSDNDPRQRPTQRDVHRHRYRSDLQCPDPAQCHQPRPAWWRSVAGLCCPVNSAGTERNILCSQRAAAMTTLRSTESAGRDYHRQAGRSGDTGLPGKWSSGSGRRRGLGTVPGRPGQPGAPASPQKPHNSATRRRTSRVHSCACLARSPRQAGDAPRWMDRDGRLHRDRPGGNDPADQGSRRRAALTGGGVLRASRGAICYGLCNAVRRGASRTGYSEACSLFGPPSGLYMVKTGGAGHLLPRG